MTALLFHHSVLSPIFSLASSYPALAKCPGGVIFHAIASLGPFAHLSKKAHTSTLRERTVHLGRWILPISLYLTPLPFPGPLLDSSIRICIVQNESAFFGQFRRPLLMTSSQACEPPLLISRGGENEMEMKRGGQEAKAKWEEGHATRL